MYLSIAFMCAAIVPGSFCYEDIHKFMSPEEVVNVFHTDVDSVPEYEVVKVHMPERLHKRGLPSGSRLHMKAFGNNINLWLHPRDSILAGANTPVYYAKYSRFAPEGVEYRRQHGLMEMVGRILEDSKEMASLVIGKEETGRTRVNGYIGSRRIAVRALPQRVVDEYSRRRRSVDDLEDPRYSPYHVVIKMNETFDDNYPVSPMNATRLQERLTRSVTQVPKTLYPEILVVVDNSVYNAFKGPRGHDVYGLLEYLLAFWNGVDLKYRSLESPRFRLNIAGIVIAEDAYATPYIGRHMLSQDAFNSSIAMVEAKSFYYRVKATFPLDSYDIATTMTRQMFGIGSGVLGMAWVRSICQKDNRGETTNSVTIYKDNGVFSGVHVIAHELGHAFGAHHDSTTISLECRTDHGYIMTFTPWYTTNSSDFSSCTIRQFQEHLDDQGLTCLYNRPHNGGPNLPKILPGTMKNVEAQCKAHTGVGKSCQHKHPEHSVCVNMFCEETTRECRETGVAALDGTKCGQNAFCLHQRCVTL